jgi:UTP:GlnB (protein PII) uridylyltransferase
VCATIIDLAARHKLSDDELEVLNELIQQHNLMIDIIKPFERKEGEV